MRIKPLISHFDPQVGPALPDYNNWVARASRLLQGGRHVALDDVWRTTMPLDDTFDENGFNFVQPAMLAQHEVVKKLTIDEKIQF